MSNTHPFSSLSTTAAVLLLPTCKGLEVIDPTSIIKIEALSNYSRLYFASGKRLVVAKVLYWFEERLAVNGFIRVHRSHLINKNHIRTCCAGMVVLLSGETVAVAKRKRAGFLQQIKNEKALARV